MRMVLLVEDEKPLSKLIAKALSAEGYGVFTAYDGLEGLSKFKQYRDKIDLVILDIVLPGIDGIEVLRRIKKDPEASNIPVFILTNVNDPDILKAASAMGASLNFVKDKTKFSLLKQWIHEITNQINSS